VRVFVDAGVTSVDDARGVIDAGASTVVVGLETLSRFDALAEIGDAVGGGRVAFSVDLRDGRPVAAPNVDHALWPVTEIVRRAVRAGAGTLIVLDLARVGTGAGTDADLIAGVRRVAGGVSVFAGGGVRGEEDLRRLAEVGCDGVLVATALLTGRIRV
jgi:phosphoribosylformimino-5-aminoimidazole carboxamide ribotide isomerase